jgi:hypothetical protein
LPHDIGNTNTSIQGHDVDEHYYTHIRLVFFLHIPEVTFALQNHETFAPTSDGDAQGLVA